MAKDKTKRYSTAVDLAKALNLVAFGNEGNLTPATMTGLRSGVYNTSTPAARGRTGLAVAGTVLVVAVVGFFLLRNQLFAPQQIEPTLVPATSIPTLAPTEAVTSPLPFAPSCAAGIVIPTPEVKETNKACIEKIPYTSVSIPEGTTFESTKPEFTCKIAATSKGKSIITCTGKQSFSYNLKVCVPPVVSSADSGKCAQGATFDSANQCCLATPPDGAGCTIFKVDLRSCK